MLFNIMDVNHDGEIVARIRSNNGKNALKQFRRDYCISAGFWAIKKAKFNWYFRPGRQIQIKTGPGAAGAFTIGGK